MWIGKISSALLIFRVENELYQSNCNIVYSTAYDISAGIEKEFCR
jgi:hypothetical protein